MTKHMLPGLLLLLLPTLVLADTTVRFETQQSTAWGESVYVLGDHPALGGDDMTRAKRMVYGDGGNWSLSVSLPEGVSYRYRYVVRSNDANAIANASNGRDVSASFSGQAPGTPLTRTVTVRYLSGWSSPTLRYLHSPGRVQESGFRWVGNGRGQGESLWEATAITTSDELVFVIRGDGGATDRGPDGNVYRSGFSSLTLASGRAYEGQPSVNALATGGGRIVQISNWYSHNTLNARPIQVYLPPSYDGSQRRYPVLYMHDGQNLFGPDALFGGWRVAATVDRLIAAGQLREVIVVGVGNTSRRMSEYIPDADGGEASRYGRFLTDELKPWVDRTWRTLPAADQTGVCGSSLGGIVSLYLGIERPDVFGRVASLSGSFWLKDWVTQLEGRQVSAWPNRIWLDSGNQGNSADSLENTLHVRDVLLKKGRALGGNLEHFVDYGARHNEASWRGRLDQVLRYLFPPE